MITKNGLNATHKGIMFGFIPVYLNMDNGECPGVEGRNWFCEFLMDIVIPIYLFIGNCMIRCNPTFEPVFMIKITGELDGNK